MKSYYFFPACLLNAAVLTGCVQPQKNLQRDPTSPIAGVQLSSNVQSARPDVFAAPLEVVRYDRYLLVSTSPSQAQRSPLEQVIDIRIPASLSPTVADAMHYVLRQSGFSLCSITSANRVLYNQALPAVHHQLGPIRLSDALQILAGPAWQLEVDSVQRVVCHSLRGGFRLPPALTPAPIVSSHFLQPPAVNPGATTLTIKKTAARSASVRAVVAPFRLTSIERRGGTVFVAMAPLQAFNLADIRLVETGETVQGWTLLSAGGNQAQFSVAGRTQTLTVQ